MNASVSERHCWTVGVNPEGKVRNKEGVEQSWNTGGIMKPSN